MDTNFQLKDGRICTIRECVEADAEPVLKLFRIAAAESDNLGRLPDEIKLTIEEEREYIRVRRESEKVESEKVSSQKRCQEDFLAPSKLFLTPFLRGDRLHSRARCPADPDGSDLDFQFRQHGPQLPRS